MRHTGFNQSDYQRTQEIVRQYLAAQGLPTAEIQRFLLSKSGETMLLMLTELHVYLLEQDTFEDDYGETVNKVYAYWQQGSNCRRANCERPEIRPHDYGNPTYCLEFPIAGEMLSEGERKEAENFIRIYEDHLDHQITTYLSKLAASIGINSTDRQECLDALIQKLFSSPCIHAYAADELYGYEAASPTQSGGGFLDREEKLSALSVLQDIYEPTFADKTYYMPVFLYGEFSQYLYLYGHVFVHTRNACGRCDACKVLDRLSQLTAKLGKHLPYWYLLEVYEFLLHRRPLPTKLGRLLLSVSGKDVLSIPSCIEIERGIRVIGDPVFISSAPQVRMELLPILPREFVGRIYQELSLKLSPQQWGMLHLVSSREGLTYLTQTYSGTHRRRGYGELRRLLREWNRVAPVEWRLENSSNRVELSRMLKKIRNALQQPGQTFVQDGIISQENA